MFKISDESMIIDQYPLNIFVPVSYQLQPSLPWNPKKERKDKLPCESNVSIGILLYEVQRRLIRGMKLSALWQFMKTP